VKKFYIGTALVMTQLFTAGSAVQAQVNPGAFFDWFTRDPADPGAAQGFTPLPWAGEHYHGNGTSFYDRDGDGIKDANEYDLEDILDYDLARSHLKKAKDFVNLSA
jgi:hypothetical protein